MSPFKLSPVWQAVIQAIIVVLSSFLGTSVAQ